MSNTGLSVTAGETTAGRHGARAGGAEPGLPLGARPARVWSGAPPRSCLPPWLLVGVPCPSPLGQCVHSCRPLPEGLVESVHSWVTTRTLPRTGMQCVRFHVAERSAGRRCRPWVSLLFHFDARVPVFYEGPEPRGEVLRESPHLRGCVVLVSPHRLCQALRDHAGHGGGEPGPAIKTAQWPGHSLRFQGHVRRGPSAWRLPWNQGPWKAYNLSRFIPEKRGAEGCSARLSRSGGPSRATR